MRSMRKSSRAVVILLGIALVLFALSATVWAAWGNARLSGLGAAIEARLTATPTRTPRPVTLTPRRGSVEPAIVAFTATPIPTAVATATPAPPRPPSAALSPYLAQIVAQYGMDPSRRFIVVDPNVQRMTIWEPDKAARELPISTGDEEQGYHTPAWYGLVGKYWGTFHAYGTYADEGWYLLRRSDRQHPDSQRSL